MRDRLEHSERRRASHIAYIRYRLNWHCPHKFHNSRQGHAGKRKQRCAQELLAVDEQANMLSFELEDIKVDSQLPEGGTRKEQQSQSSGRHCRPCPSCSDVGRGFASWRGGLVVVLVEVTAG
jgi:hypothetical protein